MGSLSNLQENKVLNHVLKVEEDTPATLYVALCTGSVTDAMVGSTLPEVPDAGNYARVAAGAFDAAASRTTANTAEITFPACVTTAWGTVTSWALTDSATHLAGNVVAYGDFTTPKSIVDGNTAKILAGDLDISVTTGGMSTYLANELLDHILGTGAFTQPTNLYAGLTTGSLADATTGTTVVSTGEPADLSYARKLHNSWATSSVGISNNFGSLTFATATGSWGTLASTFLADALTAGNILFYGTLANPQAIGVNDILEFATGSFSVTLD